MSAQIISEPQYFTEDVSAGSPSSSLIQGAGTSASPYTFGTTANVNGRGFWTESRATTGDTRNTYLRHFFRGAGGSGEALRAFGTVDNVTAATGGTVNGLHASLSVQGASGAISGAGHAMRATLGLGAGTTAGGTVDVMQLDTDIASDANIPANTAFLSLDNVGSKKLPLFFRAANMDTTDLFTAAGTGANSAAVSTGGVAAKALKVMVNGTAYWIGLYSSNS